MNSGISRLERAISLSIAAAIVISSSANAQETDAIIISGVLDGSLRYASGVPVAGAQVSLRRSGATIREVTTTSGPDGRFRVTLDTGTYSIRVALAGRASDSVIVGIAPGERKSIDLRLTQPGFQLSTVQVFTSMPGSRLFTLSEPNYFLFAWQKSDPSIPFANDRYLEQIKFRVALRYRAISFGEHEFDSGIYVAYRQNSFWHLWEDSAPFFDNNYNPYVFFFWDSRDVKKYKVPSVRVFVEHESNGRDGPDSRSWNRLGAGFDFGDYESSWIFANTRIWNAFSVGGENHDLEKYAGIGEVTVSIQPLVQKGYLLGSAGFNARVRFDRDFDARNFEANAFLGSKTFGASGWMGRGLSRVNASLMIQYFSGRAENLLSYQESHRAFRIGLATVR